MNGDEIRIMMQTLFEPIPDSCYYQKITPKGQKKDQSARTNEEVSVENLKNSTSTDTEFEEAEAVFQIEPELEAEIEFESE